jgi:phosphotransferase system HPr (HPr) family protein
MTTQTEDVLSPSAIAVGATAADRAEAIQIVGAMLVAHGLVTDEYVAAMQAREAIISTYLGNGIALPHGTSEAEETILRTGLAVAQFPHGVAWGDDTARVVIGLAARSEEHIGILSRLASILEDASLCEQLGSVQDPLEIHAALTAETEGPGRRPGSPPSGAQTRTVRIANPHGLHARPAAQIVERAMAFDADVRITAASREANALSITQVIALGATVGDEVTVRASGSDATAALDAVLGVLLADAELP